MKPVLAAACVLVIGCVTLPAEEPSVAGYVGDRAHISLGEVVVSVPSRSGPASYNNLHVVLAAIINPTETSYWDTYDVLRIVRRMESRISARVVQVVLAAGSFGPTELSSLRDRIASEGQTEFDTAFSKWKHASAFQVDLAVTSIYFTDGSVGRAGPPR